MINDQDKLSEVITFRVTDEEKKEIDRLCSREDKPRADWLRARVRDVILVYRELATRRTKARVPPSSRGQCIKSHGVKP